MPHVVAGSPRPSAPAVRPCSQTWVVIPTYDEVANLPPLVERLLAALDGADARLLIVDDDSPDGTGRLAETLAERHPQVCVLHRREKAGLGAAYLHGFRAALDAGASRVVQMDADLSHLPEDVPRLVEASRSCDLVLGSRYVAGGSTPDWALRRRLISRAGCAYSRAVLRAGVRDLTGGFKCWSRRALEAIDLDRVLGRGYVFQVEMTYRALRAGMQVAEVPIEFRDRAYGESKMRGSIVFEAVARVPQLRRAVGSEALAPPAGAELALAPAVTDG